jgi:hypothetical protein
MSNASLRVTILPMTRSTTPAVLLSAIDTYPLGLTLSPRQLYKLPCWPASAGVNVLSAETERGLHQPVYDFYSSTQH